MSGVHNYFRHKFGFARNDIRLIIIAQGSTAFFDNHTHITRQDDQTTTNIINITIMFGWNEINCEWRFIVVI